MNVHLNISGNLPPRRSVPLPPELSLRLRTLRATRGFSQEELSRRAQVDRSHISHVETGKARPKPGTLRRLAIALAVAPETLTRCA